jgi:hypothetical protein
MSRRALAGSPAAVAMVVAASLLWAPVALGVFSDPAQGGPQLVSTSDLTPPAAVSATVSNCRHNKPVELNVTWTSSESNYASSYTVERAAKSAGPFVVIATLPATQTSYSETLESGMYSTSDYYRISVLYRSWSDSSTAVSVTTLGKTC